MKKLLYLSFFCCINALHADVDMQNQSIANTDYQALFRNTALIVIAFLVVIFVFIWLIRRISNMREFQTNNQKHIKVIERRALSPKTAIYLLQVGAKKIVVAESQLEVKHLGDVQE